MRYAILIAGLLCSSAFAAESTSSAATPAASAKLDCVQPEFPGAKAKPAKIEAFNKLYQAYGDCVNAFIQSQNAIVAAAEAQRKLELERANAAIDAGNAATAAYKEYAARIELASKGK